ncbi:MAG: carboxypeptidase regulatory-like domain-containing protein [Elusimicrobiota bacterium]
MLKRWIVKGKWTDRKMERWLDGKWNLTIFPFIIYLSISLSLYLSTCLYGASGEGSLTVSPDAFTVGSCLPGGTTFTFTVGPSSITVGGQVLIAIPGDWPLQSIDESGNGYVSINTVTTDAEAVEFSVTTDTSTSNILVEVTAGTVNPGQQIYINYKNFQVPYCAQQNIKLPIFSCSDSESKLGEISALPIVNINPGLPEYISFENYGLTIKKDTASPTIKLTVRDIYWNITKATATITVSLTGRFYNSISGNYETDTTAKFSTTADFLSEVTSIVVPVDSSEAIFYYKTSKTGSVTTEISYYLNYEKINSLWLNVIETGISNAKIHTGDFANITQITITPDGDNINDRAYIDFTLPENLSWQVIIATSTDFALPLWTYYGSGVPLPGQVTWEGWLSYYDHQLNYWRYEKAPNGTYKIRIQVSGAGIVDDTLSVTVQTLEISGRVIDEGGVGISGVWVNAWGPSCSYTQTDTNGYYKVSGLRSGKYNLNFYKYGYPSKNLSNIDAGSTVADVKLEKPGILKINATRTLSATAVDPENWGGINVYGPAGYYWGTLHFAEEVSISDNGIWSTDISKNYLINNGTDTIGGKWTVIFVAPGTYDLRADLWGYGYIEKKGISISAGQITEITDISFVRKKSITGVIRLSEPSAETWGTWVSVEAIPSGYSYGTAWGGCNIPQGATTGNYTIFGVEAGNYTLKAFAPGYKKGTTTVTILTTDDTVTAAEIVLTTGGQLTGTVTVIGDTTDPALGFSAPYTLYLNAWSPESYSYGWTQVQIAQHPTSADSNFTIRGLEDGTYFVSSYLQGFELDNSLGFCGTKATVSNGTGSVDLIFRRYSGRVTAKFIVPGNDYTNLRVNFNAPGCSLNDISIPDGSFTSPPVGSGYCSIEGIYLLSGMQKSKSVMAVNGQTRDAGSIDLTGETYSVSGEVKIDTKNPPPKPFDDLSIIVSSAAAVSAYNPARVYIEGSGGSIKGTAVDGGSSSGKSFNIGPSGTFTLSGLEPGVHTLVFPSLELDGNWDNGKEIYEQRQRIVVDKDITGIEIELSGGYSVSGSVYLPEGEPAVTREFRLEVRKGWNYLTGVRVNFLNSNSASYEVKNLPPGEYTFSINDWGYWDSTAQIYRPKQYASASVNVTVEGSNVSGKDLRLKKGGNIKFKLKDKDSGTVITPQNATQMLPSNFSIDACANPWVEGGWSSLSSISATAEEFKIECLPETSYDLILKQDKYGFGIMGSAYGGSQVNYAQVTISSIKVKEAQTTDLGTIELRQGLSISGTVKDKNGNPLPNIPVVANPSLTNEWQSELQAVTDTTGKYTITGIDPDIPYYDIIACPRMIGECGYFFGFGGITYGEKVRPMVKIKETAAVDFILEEAFGSVKGKVITEDTGKPPVSIEEDEMGAMVFMQLENTIPRTNPIGDIMAAVEFDGSFKIEALPKGTYNLLVVVPGYSSVSKTVTVEDKEVDLGTLTLKVGAKISGEIKKPDGKRPSKDELDIIVAATDDMADILVGQLKKTGNEITGYELSGFQAGKSYNILFILPEGFELVPAVCGFTVAYSSYVNTNYNLEYKPVKPVVFSRATRAGNKFTIYFELTSALRNTMPSDNDLSQIITIVSGNGELSDRYLAPNRKALSCIYTAPSSENRFVLKIKGYSRIINPETGTEFEIDEPFEYYCGIGAKNRIRISNLRGGKITLEGDASNVQFLSGAFEVTSSTITLYVEFTKAETYEELKVTQSPTKGAPGFVIPRGAPAYSGNTYKAMETLKTVGISPFSSFYEIMLPAGISRVLKKDAKLSLQYSSVTVSDPTELNVYYYDEQNNVYLLEKKNKTVDTAANTITVSVNHASVFVLLKSNLQTIVGNTYTGTEVIVYNFPNPFNLVSKTKNLTHSSQQITTKGTVIKYAIPPDYGNVDVKITIYNIVGELIREIEEGIKSGGYYYYTEWNGENDYQKEVASGVYLGKLEVGEHKHKFFKLAVIK